MLTLPASGEVQRQSVIMLLQIWHILVTRELAVSRSLLKGEKHVLPKQMLLRFLLCMTPLYISEVLVNLMSCCWAGCTSCCFE